MRNGLQVEPELREQRLVEPIAVLEGGTHRRVQRARSWSNGPPGASRIREKRQRDDRQERRYGGGEAGDDELEHGSRETESRGYGRGWQGVEGAPLLSSSSFHAGKRRRHARSTHVKDLMGLMKQAQVMQAKMAEVQAELEALEVQGQSGGGLVTVTLSAKGAMRAVVIDDSLVKADEKEILEDLLVTAHEDARKKAERLTEEKMRDITAGLPLPPGMKLPF